MRKTIVVSETVVTSIEPKRVVRQADECLLSIRVVESRKESTNWIHEYEVTGEPGKIEKFLARIRDIEHPH